MRALLAAKNNDVNVINFCIQDVKPATRSYNV